MAIERARKRERPADVIASYGFKPVRRWVNGRDPRQYGLDFGL